MVYFTGDIHGAINSIEEFIDKVHPTPEDIYQDAIFDTSVYVVESPETA